MLAYNVFIFGDDSLSGSNQFILLMGAAVASMIGFKNKVSFSLMMNEVAENVKTTSSAIFILLMVGALAGTWLVSGIIPTMIYYGLQILNPTIFLPACLIICAVISVATGSSWTTAATVGIALIGIAEALGIPLGMTAGAVLSGAYFGDKMSPMSDTTNLAPAMAGTDLFTHIKYMAYTTIPTFIITLIIFVIIGLTLNVNGEAADTVEMLRDIDKAFNINPWLFLVPIIVIGLITKKTPPLIALTAGTILAAIFALFFQPQIIMNIAGATELNFNSAYKGLMTAITVNTSIVTDNEILADLFTSGGMAKMMGTIWLILCAMVFGGIMDAIGALAKISSYMLQLFDSTFGLFASTVFTCIGLNFTASDQYLAIVVPGKMYSKAFKEKGLAPENLSRTLEDSGTVTSVLIPWNTCGAYHSNVLGVSVADYFVYAIFNWLSPFTTLFFAALNIKIRQMVSNKV
jgi:NhaC family Na+:H+ antiporter